MTPAEARERVERGAALLDEKSPGWREKVDPETLEMWSKCGCVLGQTFGSFTKGLDLLALDYLEDEEDARHGFDVDSGPESSNSEEADFDLLQDAWLEQLRGTS